MDAAVDDFYVADSNAYREEEYHLFNQAISNFNQSTKSTEPVIILSPNSLTEVS